MDNYMQTENVDLYKSIVNDLDGKYGDGTTLELYKILTNLSLHFSVYDGELTSKRIDKIYADIARKDEKITDMLQQGTFDKNSLDVISQINNTFKNKLDDICQSLDGIEDSKEAMRVRRAKRNEDLEKLEYLSLKCIDQDIKKISSKNEALDYIQKWDYYRNRCCIPGNHQINCENGVLSENFKLVSTIQHNLYKKCIEYGALNIEKEDIFDRLIEAHLFNVQDAKMTIVIDDEYEEKLIISDKYLCNQFDVISKKNGKRKYSTGNEDYYRRKERREKDFGK